MMRLINQFSVICSQGARCSAQTGWGCEALLGSRVPKSLDIPSLPPHPPPPECGLL